MTNFQPVTIRVPELHNQTLFEWDVFLVVTFVALGVGALMLALSGRGRVALASFVAALLLFAGFTGGWLRIEMPWPDRISSNELGVALNEKVRHYDFTTITVWPGQSGFTLLHPTGTCSGELETSYEDSTVTLTPDPGECMASFGWKPFVEHMARKSDGE